VKVRLVLGWGFEKVKEVDVPEPEERIFERFAYMRKVTSAEPAVVEETEDTPNTVSVIGSDGQAVELDVAAEEVTNVEYQLSTTTLTFNLESTVTDDEGNVTAVYKLIPGMLVVTDKGVVVNV